jgi:hypothetical protein
MSGPIDCHTPSAFDPLFFFGCPAKLVATAFHAARASFETPSGTCPVGIDRW